VQIAASESMIASRGHGTGAGPYHVQHDALAMNELMSKYSGNAGAHTSLLCVSLLS
jgi:hypothetical protein